MAASTPDDTTKADDDRSAARWGARQAEATEAAEDGGTPLYAVVGTDRLIVPIADGDDLEVLRTGSPVPAERLDAVKAAAKAVGVKLRKVRS